MGGVGWLIKIHKRKRGTCLWAYPHSHSAHKKTSHHVHVHLPFDAICGERCLQSSFCAIWQIVATHVGFVGFGKISQIRVTFATIFHNSDKSLITFVLFRVISPIHVYFSAIFTNSSKKKKLELDRFCAILSNSTNSILS